jgi:erythromycin esterase
MPKLFSTIALPLTLVFLSLAPWSVQAASTAPLLQNPDFDKQGQAGKPDGWNIVEQSGYTVRSECAPACVLAVQSTSDHKNGNWLRIDQAVVPAGAAGHRLVYAGAIRTEGLSGGVAYLNAEVVSVNGDVSYYIMPAPYPTGTSGWAPFEVAMPIPQNARKIVVALGAAGTGKLWFDKLQLRVDDSVAVPADMVYAPRPVASQALLGDDALRIPDAAIAPVPPAWRDDVRTRRHAIRSLFSDDFSDLQFLKPLLAGKRVVQLGESSHGVAEFSLIKARLIKFLHQELGYDVLAVEGSLAQCFHADRAATQLDPRDLMGKCLFGNMNHQELKPAFAHLQATRKAGRPFNLAGFDNQDSSGDPSETDMRMQVLLLPLSPTLAARLPLVNGDLRRQYAKQANGPMDAAQAATMTAFYEEVASTLAAGRAQLLAAGCPADEADMAVQYFKSRGRLVQQLASTPAKYSDLRDQAMANNVEFLMDKLYPGRKVVVYAHNAHIAYQAVPNGGTPMGSHLAGRRKSEVYTIGLYMGRGHAAYNNGAVYQIGAPKPDSIEAALANGGLKYAFFDMSQTRAGPGSAWMTQPGLVREWGNLEGRITPASTYDALIYIDEVTPPRR